ncbi:hypothetical protein [Streptomyces sp. NPDC060035]|uniref:hypothetical protein n=1 Tax=Streptomyces sp. NPDC060035 TaxID=3347044 RepID=UPI00368CF984
MLALAEDAPKDKCHRFRDPRDGEYGIEPTAVLGTSIDLTGTRVGIALATGGFGRD